MNQLLETLRTQNPQLPDLLLKPLLAFLLAARELSPCEPGSGDLELNIILLVIAIRTVEHAEFSNLSMRERLEDLRVFPSLGVNTHSIAESSGIPRETVRRKVAKLVRNGWIARRGSTLHFTSQGFRETSLVREAMECLALEYGEVIRKELAKMPTRRDTA
jgi:hypothetical protein